MGGHLGLHVAFVAVCVYVKSAIKPMSEEIQ
jgi:hypothetical protein